MSLQLDEGEDTCGWGTLVLGHNLKREPCVCRNFVVVGRATAAEKHAAGSRFIFALLGGTALITPAVVIGFLQNFSSDVSGWILSQHQSRGPQTGDQLGHSR
jgi:hypothetical protein